MFSVWYLTRAAGLTAYVFLFFATATGLLVSLRLAPQRLRPVLDRIHQAVGTISIFIVGIHCVVLLLDTHVRFTLLDLFVPFFVADRPRELGAGILAFYTMIILIGTATLRARTGFRKLWRKIHRLAIPGFFLVIFHSVALGTDATEPGIRSLYIVTAAIITGLIVVKGIVYCRGEKTDTPSTREEL